MRYVVSWLLPRAADARHPENSVLWFSKGPRRRNQLMVPTVARSSSKDKSLHPWQQGDAVWHSNSEDRDRAAD